MDITLTSLLSAAGAISAALAVRQLVELLKFVFPALDARVSGKQQAFAVSLLLYVWAAMSVGTSTPESIFGAFLAWLACATASVGLDQIISASPLDRVLSRPSSE